MVGCFGSFSTTHPMLFFRKKEKPTDHGAAFSMTFFNSSVLPSARKTTCSTPAFSNARKVRSIEVSPSKWYFNGSICWSEEVAGQ